MYQLTYQKLLLIPPKAIIWMFDILLDYLNYLVLLSTNRTNLIYWKIINYLIILPYRTLPKKGLLYLNQLNT